jgi:hypothetical protein
LGFEACRLQLCHLVSAQHCNPATQLIWRTVEPRGTPDATKRASNEEIKTTEIYVQGIQETLEKNLVIMSEAFDADARRIMRYLAHTPEDGDFTIGEDAYVDQLKQRIAAVNDIASSLSKRARAELGVKE